MNETACIPYNECLCRPSVPANARCLLLPCGTWGMSNNEALSKAIFAKWTPHGVSVIDRVSFQVGRCLGEEGERAKAPLVDRRGSGGRTAPGRRVVKNLQGAEVIFGECLFSWQRALALVTRCLGARNEIEMYTEKRTKTKITDVIFGSCSAPSLKAE